MDILQRLRALENYFQRNIAVGHTEAMMRGVLNVDRVAVLFPTYRMADKMVKPRNPKAKLLSYLMMKDLYGMNLPLILDHTAIEVLCEEAADEIEKLRNLLRRKTNDAT